MRIQHGGGNFRGRIYRGGISRSAFFAVGVAAGIFFINIQKSTLSSGGLLFHAESIKRIAWINAYGSALFAFVVRERMTQFLLLSVFATTYLGIVACDVAAGWYGFSCGVYLASAMLYFGAKGILFILAGIFPQYLLYVPTVWALFKWCDKTCGMIYGKTLVNSQNQKAPLLAERVLSLITLAIASLVGCFLESYVNPHFLNAFAKLL